MMMLYWWTFTGKVFKKYAALIHNGSVRQLQNKNNSEMIVPMKCWFDKNMNDGGMKRKFEKYWCGRKIQGVWSQKTWDLVLTLLVYKLGQIAKLHFPICNEGIIIIGLLCSNDMWMWKCFVNCHMVYSVIVFYSVAGKAFVSSLKLVLLLAFFLMIYIHFFWAKT